MKKIIFAALSVLMILSLVGCGEHIDYTPNKAFSTGDVAGVMNGWPVGNASNWTTADDDNYVYTYEFTALKEMGTAIQFKVRSTAGKWDTGDFGGAKLDTKGTKAELTPADFGGPSAEFEVEASHKYKITVTSEDGKVYGKVEDLGLDVVPMPFVLNGMAISIDGVAPTLDTALMSFEKDLKGNLTYKVRFVATATEHTFAITDVEGKLKYTSDKAIELTKTVDLKAAGEKDKAATITGLEAGSRYEVTITTTPAGKVSVVVDDSPIKVSFTFEMIGLTPGNQAWMNGTFWGEDWPNGWPIEGWGGLKGPEDNPFTKADIPTANKDGVAKFSDKFNVTHEVKPGELSYKFKAIYNADANWPAEGDPTGGQSSDLEAKLTVTEEGNYKVTVDASDSYKVTVTKQ